MSQALDLARRVLAAEGPRGFAARAAGRLAEWRRERSFAPARPDEPLGAPVLHLLGTSPRPDLGGVQLQLAERLAVERASRPVALLYPRAGRYRLEHEARGRRCFLDLGPAPAAPASALASPELERAVLQAAAATGASLVHLENPAGLPLGSLLSIASQEEGPQWVISVHDFSLFCPRPHLLEEPTQAFCEYSRDPGRCAACLAETWSVPPGFQEERREVARRLLLAAARVVYPSGFLHDQHLALFPGLDPARQRVIPPGIRLPHFPVPPSSGHPPRHVAFAGSVQVHKGAGVFVEAVSQLAPRHPEVRWSVLGGGDAALLRSLRRLPNTRVHGFYRPGALPHRLRGLGVDLAVLPSIVPESYGLALEECAAAGVPAVAFDLGAPAERIRALGGGILLPLRADAFIARLDALLAGREPVPSPRAAGAPPTPAEAAATWRALYEEVGAGIP